MKTATLATAAALALTACAQTPSAIQPIPMGNVYSNLNCSQARALHNTEQQNLVALTAQQNGAVAGDAIGVLLIGVPVSSLTGQDVAGDIGAAKGKLMALGARLQNC